MNVNNIALLLGVQCIPDIRSTDHPGYMVNFCIQLIPLSYFWISAACGENKNFALPPLLEFRLTKYDFLPKSLFFEFFQPKFQEGVAYFSSYLRHGGMTIEYSSSGHSGMTVLLAFCKIEPMRSIFFLTKP